MRRKIITLVFALGISIGLVGALPANVEATLTEQKEQSEANIAKFKEEIESLDGQIFEMLSKIEEVETEITQKEQTISDLEVELALKEEELNATNIKFDQQKESYYSHLRSKYEEGDVSFTDIILDSSNITDFINFNEYYRIVREQEENDVQELKDIKLEIENQKVAIEENKATTEAEKTALSTEKGKLEAVKSTYDAAKSDLESQLAAEESARQQILSEIDALVVTYTPAGEEPSYGGNYTGSGSLQWPVPSISPSTTNTQSFGSSHKGFDIGGYTDTNRAVIAADSGTVIKAEWYYGYGNYVMIDHGNGMVTAYGHLSSFAVSAGQSIGRGETIGIMGNTGNSFGIHLHFEVIISGTYVNPEPYIR